MPNARRRERGAAGAHSLQRRDPAADADRKRAGHEARLPFDRDTTAFWVIIASLAVILGGMVAYFRRRGWL